MIPVNLKHFLEVGFLSLPSYGGATVSFMYYLLPEFKLYKRGWSSYAYWPMKKGLRKPVAEIWKKPTMNIWRRVTSRLISYKLVILGKYTQTDIWRLPRGKAVESNLAALPRQAVYFHLMMISNHSLDLGGSGEDIAYPLALIGCLLRSPSKMDVRTGGSQQKLTAHFAFSRIHKLKFAAYHEARQTR